MPITGQIHNEPLTTWFRVALPRQVRALILVLQAHMGRKDIVRAAMRSAANLIRMPSVVRRVGKWLDNDSGDDASKKTQLIRRYFFFTRVTNIFGRMHRVMERETRLRLQLLRAARNPEEATIPAYNHHPPPRRLEPKTSPSLARTRGCFVVKGPGAYVGGERAADCPPVLGIAHDEQRDHRLRRCGRRGPPRGSARGRVGIVVWFPQRAQGVHAASWRGVCAVWRGNGRGVEHASVLCAFFSYPTPYRDRNTSSHAFRAASFVDATHKAGLFLLKPQLLSHRRHDRHTLTPLCDWFD